MMPPGGGPPWAKVSEGKIAAARAKTMLRSAAKNAKVVRRGMTLSLDVVLSASFLISLCKFGRIETTRYYTEYDGGGVRD